MFIRQFKMEKLLIFTIIGIFLISFAYSFTTIESKEKIVYVNQTVYKTIIDIPVIYKLERTLSQIKEDTNIENGNCLSYALYYKEYLNNNYPMLDVRKIDLAGICKIGTIECKDSEGTRHTYLIVNGWGGECILDQHELKCIQVVK